MRRMAARSGGVPPGRGLNPVARAPVARRERRSRCAAAPAPGLSGLAGKRLSFLARTAARPSRTARAPDPGRASPAGRRLALLPAALPAGVLAVLLGAVPAQAQDTDPVWSATLTARDLGATHGCDDNASTDANKCEPTTGALSDDDFTLGGTTYEVNQVSLHDTELKLRLYFAQTVSDALRGLVLLVGDQRFALAQATLSNCDNGTNNCLVWDNGPSAWTDNASVALSLKSPASLTTPVQVVPATRRLTVAEGGTATFTVALASKPTATVTIALRKARSGQDAISFTPTTLSFTATGTTIWSTPQTVTVTGQEDADNTDESVLILPLVESNDSYYREQIRGVHVTVDDDEVSDDPALAGLALSRGTLAPRFDPDTTFYAASVPRDVASVTVTPTARNSGASVTVDGQSATSGEASGPIALSHGAQDIAVAVTAQDGSTTRTYTVTVTRGHALAALVGLTLSAGTLAPPFAPGTTQYRANVAQGVGQVTVTPTVARAGATVTVNGWAVASGQPSRVMALNAGEPRTVTVVVTEGSTTRTYTVTVTRAGGTPGTPVTPPVTPPPPPPPPPPVTPAGPTLSALSLSAGWLAFAPQTSAYAVEVPYAVAGVTVTPAASDSGATVTVNGVEVPSGEASAAIALAVGETVIPIVVTAQNGTTTRTYTVTVTRGHAELALLPAASGALHGFVRVVNASDEAGTVRIRAFDDAGTEYAPVTLAIGAGEARHFNATDLESGNPDKGLTGATGAPEAGRWWRLVFESELGVRVMGYVRTGPLGAMHDEVTETQSQDGYRYEVVFFNPASNAAQASVLRVVNRSQTEAAVTITGTDDAGEAGDEAVTLTLPAGAARMLGAPALESGGEEFEGALGDGTGKWRLVVDSDRPLGVMSLNRSPDGHLTNLSTAPPASRTKRKQAGNPAGAPHARPP